MNAAVVAALVTLAVSEPAMTLVHRFVFHGPLWCWHKSHHEHPSSERLVVNDLLWLGPLATAVSLFVAALVFGPGVVSDVLAGIAVGIVGYVAAYVFAHDGVAHGRFWVPGVVRRTALFRGIARTHQLHHRGGTDGVGASPFGVYSAALEQRLGLSDGYAPPTKICS